MKISPVKNYVKPKYALKLAALLAATVSVSACAEGGGKPAQSTSGAGYKPQTTTEEVRLAGEVENTTEGAILDGDVAIPESTSSDEPQVDGYLDVPEDTTTTTTTTETQVEGYLSVPEDSTAATKAAAVTTAATTLTTVGTTLAGTSPATEETTYEPAVLAGEADTTSEYEEPQIMGDFPVSEYEEPQLEGGVVAPEPYEETVTAGVVAAPEENVCKSEGCIFAERNLAVLKNAFESYKGLSFMFIEGFDDPGHSRFPMFDEAGNEYSLPAPYMIERSDADNYQDRYVFVTYMQQDDPFRQFVTKNGKALYGSYLWEDKGTGLKLLIIDYDGDGGDLDPDACVKLAKSYAKAMGIS